MKTLNYFFLFFFLFGKLTIQVSLAEAPIVKEGFELFSKIEGDVNRDNYLDSVEIYFKKPNDAITIVTISNEQKEEKIKVLSKKAICIGCGGAKSSLFEPLGLFNIKNHDLYFKAAGGSRGLWEMELKWRYDKKIHDFFLSWGKLKQVDYAEKKEPTVVYEIFFDKKVGNKKIYGSKIKLKKCSLPKDSPAIKFSEFDFEDLDFEAICHLY